jgi:hypothetical protein
MPLISAIKAALAGRPARSSIPTAAPSPAPSRGLDLSIVALAGSPLAAAVSLAAGTAASPTPAANAAVAPVLTPAVADLLGIGTPGAAASAAPSAPTRTTTPAASTPPAPAATPSALAVSAAATSEAAIAAAVKARIKAIIDAPEAEVRQDLARHLAFDSDMPAVAAISILSRAAQGGGRYQSDLHREMAAIPQPKIGPWGGPSFTEMSDTQKGERAARELLNRTADRSASDA